eukprot:340418_1
MCTGKYNLVPNANPLKYCCSISYDILTILVSIADVTTDIIVLIDFYEKERMTFFIISLIVLILAQCAYAMAFSIWFETVDEIGFCLSCCLFCCLLPLGSFVAFCIYLSNEDCLDIGGTGFSVDPSDSALTKWIKRKLSKHIGFVLEALIEAFPQSLIQITAIVYYQEANIIAILSILISMASVMSKSLILSQGVEKFTFIWTWLCVVTDFFGIFFTLTWVFYSHDSLSGEWFGYFNIFGVIWLWKITISVLLPVALVLIIFCLIGYWMTFVGIISDSVGNNNVKCKTFGYCLLWLMFGPLCAILCAFCASLAGEVLCFAILAIFVFGVSTDRIRAYDTTEVGDIISFMLGFIANTTNGVYNDRIIRISVINWAMPTSATERWKHKFHNELSNYLGKIFDEGHYDAIKQITYRDLRQHAKFAEKANLPKYLMTSMIKECEDTKSEAMESDCCTFTRHWLNLWVILESYAFFIVLPIYLVSKVIQIAYPWIILVYLIWNNLLFTEQIDSFQLTMLGIYILLQL